MRVRIGQFVRSEIDDNLNLEGEIMEGPMFDEMVREERHKEELESLRRQVEELRAAHTKKGPGCNPPKTVEDVCQEMEEERMREIGRVLDEVKSGDLRYRKPDVYGGCAGKLERDLQSAQERIKQLEKDVADRDLWLAGKNASISYNAEQISELGGKLMMVTAERDAARANVEELEKLKTDPKPAITVSYSLIYKDGARIDGPKDSVMEVARLTKENEELKQKNKQLRSRIEEIRITTAQALNDSANAPV